jgi:hypothetical protein
MKPVFWAWVLYFIAIVAIWAGFMLWLGQIN